MPPLETMTYAFIGGLLPALVWLYFLLKEEERCPQPAWAIFAMFIAGMIAVPFVLPFEDLAVQNLSSDLSIIVAWATVEEVAKYLLFAAVTLFFAHAVRNSIDIVISMITVALGFAALENALFLLDPLSQGRFLAGLVTNNLRFIGSTLLHVIASSAIGFALAFSYRARPPMRAVAAAAGLILAIGLHALFNFFIIREGGSTTILAFFTVWTGAVVFFAAFEILKYFRYRNLPKNVC